MTNPAAKPPKFDPAMQAVLFGEDRQALLPRPAIVAFARIAPGMTVADLGCGNGYLLAQLSAAVGPTGRVLGSDLQDAMLSGAVALVEEQGLANVELTLAGENTIPAPSDGCDRAILCQVWHDLTHQAAYLREVDRILKPGGELIILNWEPIDTGIGPRVERRWSRERTAGLLEWEGWRVLRTTALTWANYGLAAAPPDRIAYDAPQALAAG
ncbi:MAG TPA: methyltransferase domain-containing protein [bacterium]|nr:methyltransferase domain-containing protein [bacterium]